ncbi:hypothetical protein COCNU_04G007530 [Cocos nucifera]|uniref:Uncharacterized protein n=1 Tax=Cocos nucifera TaxID=13894 RepID=A0A8K0I6L5_COCNU|nr:hypothetical protein COCNU_04G007530 [Cocos nucifera]
MERNNGPAKPADICRRIFNFLVKNLSFDRFKQLSQGSPKTSPSTRKDEESQVLVTVYKEDDDVGHVPSTVVTVEHRATAPNVSGKRHEDSTTLKDQDVGAPFVEPRKKSITIRDGTELTEEKDALGKSMGERGKAGETRAAKDGETEKKPPTGPRPKQPNPSVAPDMNEEFGNFIRRKKEDWRKS